MAQRERDDQLVQAFLELSDTLQEGFDLVEYLHVLSDHLHVLLDVTSVGVVMPDAQERLVEVTATAQTAHRTEEARIRAGEGPCRDSFRRRELVGPVDLTAPAAARHWPRFTPAARAAGFVSAAALPLHLRDDVIGSVNLLCSRPGTLHSAAMRLGQGLADMAAIGILHQRLLQDQDARVRQLQRALDSCVIIEQAKGALGAHLGITPHQAFARLRLHARARRTPLTQLCLRVVEGRMSTEDIGLPPRAQRHR